MYRMRKTNNLAKNDRSPEHRQSFLRRTTSDFENVKFSQTALQIKVKLRSKRMIYTAGFYSILDDGSRGHKSFIVRENVTMIIRE